MLSDRSYYYYYNSSIRIMVKLVDNVQCTPVVIVDDAAVVDVDVVGVASLR